MRTKEQLLKLCKLMPCTPYGLYVYKMMTEEEYTAYFKEVTQ